MQVEVKLYGVLRKKRPNGIGGAPHHPFAMTLDSEATVAQLVQQLGIAKGTLNGAAVNGTAGDLTVILQDGDKINLFPPTAGG